MVVSTNGVFVRREEPDYQGLDARVSTVDRIAFAVSLGDSEAEKRRT